MKIGILTFHRAINYGAVLQAYALQETLRSLGHDVWVIDYRQPRVERTDRRVFQPDDKINLLKGFHLRSWWNYNDIRQQTLLRRQRFDDFLQTYIHLTEPCTQDSIPVMDSYVIGSDQVWNSAICDGLDPVFWGNFNRPKASKVVSYAASTSVKDLQRHDRSVIQNYLDNFEDVSVREQGVYDFLNNNFVLRNVGVVLDPTLLAEPLVWDGFRDDCSNQREYVLYFGARKCIKYPTVLHDKAESLAKQFGCDIKTIDFNSDTPVDFVNKFRNAKAVVTSSFHGVAFSLIFNKTIYAVQYGDEQDARYTNVLKSIGAEQMLVDLYQDVCPHTFDYGNTNILISILRMHSYNFIKGI